MQLALRLAERAASQDEVPVGAVLVVRGQVLGWGFNRRERDQDPLGHAEVAAIQMAAQALGSWRMPRSTLYVTLEPCPMCAGAILQARIQRLVFGCRDPRAGAVRSLFALVDDPRLPHRTEVSEGLLEAPCKDILQAFFSNLRST